MCRVQVGWPRICGSLLHIVERFHASRKHPYRLWDPLSPLIKGFRGLRPRGVKRQGHELEHSSPSSAEVKNKWIYTSTLSYAFIACTRTVCPFL